MIFACRTNIKFNLFLVLFSAGLALGREAKFDLTPQMIHEYALNDIAYGPRGYFFASASYDRVILWEIVTGKQIRVYPSLGKGFTCLAFSPDGSSLAAGATDKTITLWDLGSGELRFIIQGHDYGVKDIAFSPDGTRLLSVASHWGSQDKDSFRNRAKQFLSSDIGFRKSAQTIIWDVATGCEQLIFPEHNGPIEPICFSPDGKTIAGGSIDFTLGQWDAETGYLIRSFSHVNHLLTAVSFSPDGMRLAGAFWGKDKRQFPARGIHVWQVDEARVRHFPKVIHDFSGYTGLVHALAFSPDGRRIVTAANDFEAYLPEPGKKTRTLPLKDITSYSGERKPLEKFKNENNHVWAKEEDGTQILRGHSTAGYKQSELKMWDAWNGTDLGTFQRKSTPIYTLAYSPDGKHVVTDGEGYSIARWSTEDLRQVQKVRGLAADILDLVYSPDGRHIANLDGSRTFRVWDVANLRKVLLFRGHKAKVNAIAFSPDSTVVASASEDRAIKLWCLETGELLQTLKCKKYPRALCFNPDGKYLLSLEWPHLFLRWLKGKRLAWWDLATGSEVVFEDRGKWDIDETKYNQIAFHGDYIMFSAGYRSLGRYEVPSMAPTDLWDVASGRPAMRFETSDAAAYSRDGRFIVTARGTALTLWDAQTHRRIHNFEGHVMRSSVRFNYKQDLGISSVVISPDSKYLASCATDKTLRIWDLKNGRCLRLLEGRFQLARFSPAGGTLLSADFDGRLQLWDIDQLVNPSKKDIQPAVTLIGLPESEDFIAFTEDLYYKSTRKGYKAVVVLKNNMAYSFDQFDAKLNRPDKVLHALPKPDPQLIKAYKAAYKKRLRKLNLKEDQLSLDFHLPTIRLQEADPSGKTTKKSVHLKLAVSDDRFALDRLLLWANGVPVQGRKGIDLRNRPGNQHTVEVEILLDWGPNTIEYSVMNEHGTESYRGMVKYTRTGTPPKPDIYLVAVGVTDYDDDTYDLRYAAKDATDLVASIENAAFSYGEVNTKVLLDKQVTRESIKQTRTFLERAEVDDLVVFFLAGHGLLDAEQNFYYATADTSFSDPASRGFAYDDIEMLMDGLRSRSKLVLIDACHSGEVDTYGDDAESAISTASRVSGSRAGGTAACVLKPGEQSLPMGVSSRGFKKIARDQPVLLANSFELMRALFVDLNRGSGSMIISSASGREFAFESPKWKNGVFTYALLEGLRTHKKQLLPKADLDENRQVAISEIRNYVTARVQKLTNGRQTPTSRAEVMATDFPLLQLAHKRVNLFIRILRKVVGTVKKIHESMTRTTWMDTFKPEQFWGSEEGRGARLPKQPDPGRYPEVCRFPWPVGSIDGNRQKYFKLQPHPSGAFGFQAFNPGRKCGRCPEQEWVYRFPRYDASKGSIYVAYKKEATSIEKQIETALTIDYANYHRIRSPYLKRGANDVVFCEPGELHGREVTYLVTATIYSSAIGNITRYYYHLLYRDEDQSIRLTTAGGHEAEQSDTYSYRYSPYLDKAVRELFQRLVFIPDASQPK